MFNIYKLELYAFFDLPNKFRLQNNINKNHLS